MIDPAGKSLHGNQKLILLSGLGATEKLFFLQKRRFPGLITPGWQQPLPAEAFDAYIDRWAVELGRHNATLIGGASFGGIIAQILARRLGIRSCILIGSIKSTSEIPWRVKAWRPLTPFTHPNIVWFWQTVIQQGQRLGNRLLSRKCNGLLSQFVSSSADLVSWSVSHFFSALNHDDFVNRRENDSRREPLDIFQLHGARDPVFPVRRIDQSSDRVFVIRDAGHVPSITHSRQVNEFIDRVLKKQLLS